MRAKDKCPSCFQPIAPTDFLCPHCELILDPSQAPPRPVGDISVVRRMLEVPQRGMPKDRPETKPVKAAARASQGAEGPTKVLNLGPELAGVPVVVATLTRKSQQISELEAWIVSLIDGLNDAGALAKKAGLREFELRVVLRTLHEKQIIDFADEPLSDADLGLPLMVGTLEEEDEVPLEPTAPVATAAPNFGANIDRRDGRFVAPPSNQRAAPPPPPPATPPPAPVEAPPVISGRRGPLIRANNALSPNNALPPELEQEAPIVTGQPVPPVLAPATGPSKPVSRRDNVLPPYPARPATAPPVVTPAGGRGSVGPLPEAPPPQRPTSERTDPRIAYTGQANRKVLDALKKVKRADGSNAPAPKEEQATQNFADVLARDTLQVALRMEQGGRLDEAIRFLERSIAQSPDAASLYNRLGIILMRERADYRRAEQLIRKAVDLAPGNNVYETNLQKVVAQQAIRSHR
jgi:tetratricopeptide (TPR) repeat protein